MKIALCQFDQVWEDKEANKQKISSVLEQISSSESTFDWIIFPELTLTGFSINASKTSLEKEDLDFFRDVALDFACFVSLGASENKFNNLITIDPNGTIISRYSKIHLYSYGGEDKSYVPGSLTQQKRTFQLSNGFRVTPFVCFDLRFPYLFWDAAEKTDIFVGIASWPQKRKEHWINLLRVRAIENQSFVVGVNRTGSDPNVSEYSGNSMIFDPMGRIVLDTPDGTEGIFMSIDIDVELVSRTRKRFPFFDDRLN